MTRKEQENMGHLLDSWAYGNFLCGLETLGRGLRGVFRSALTGRIN